MDAALKKHGQLFTLALIAAASVMFGMALAGGLNLTIPGRAAGDLAGACRASGSPQVCRTARGTPSARACGVAPRAARRNAGSPFLRLGRDERRPHAAVLALWGRDPASARVPW